MSSEESRNATAEAAAQEILRAIYGEDLDGCPVRPERIASIVVQAINKHPLPDAELFELYEKGVEAVHLLASPPIAGGPIAPEDLPGLLSGRLDTIRNLTQRLVEMSRRCSFIDEPDLDDPS
jgi:hypothetical protein